MHGIMELDVRAGRMQPVLTARNSESFKGCNDLHIASNGEIYFTDQGQTGLHDPTGRVFRLSPNGRLDCLVDTGISPNGLVLDPTETVLFVAMTRDNAVWRLPFMKDGSVSKVGRFCSTFGASGPDGLAMDKAGRLFVAHASLGHVFVFAPNGELIARIRSCAGASCTNVAIGGPNRDRLFVTESATGTVLSADIGILDSPLRGA
jgi:gluconolactonase